MATAQGLVTTLPPGDVAVAADATQRLAALRLAGAAGLDPLRLHFLEALARRAQTQPDNVQAILQARLAQGIAELQARLEQAQPAVPSGALGPAGAANDAPASDSVTDSLSALTRYLALHAAAHEGAGVGVGLGLGLGVGVGAGTLAPMTDPELKSVRHFRNTWSKLSVHKQLSQALDTAPKNAGPINSHMLVLRSLALMREISPDYLNRFMSYADTLLCLELGAAEVPSEGKAGKTARAQRSRVR